MVNVAVKLNYKVRFCDLNYKTGTISISKLQKLITNNTSALVLTNMFNNYSIGQDKKVSLEEKNHANRR